MKEMLTIYNEKLEEIGSMSREEVHRKGLKHKVVHCWIVERKEEDTWIYFQQRSYDKADFAGLYDIACAGHIDAGEKTENAIIRELEEEIGLQVSKNELNHLGTIFETLEKDDFSDDEICEIYLLEVNEDTIFNLGEEVENLVKVSLQEYKKWIDGRVKTLAAISIEDNKIVEINEENVCPHLKERNEKVLNSCEYI